MIPRPPRSTPLYSSAASDVYKRQVLERVVEGDHAPVCLGADASMSDLRVDAVSKVHGGRVRRQVEDIALGREDIDLVLEEVHLDGVEKRLRVPDLVLPLEEAAQPGQLLVEARVLPTLLVGPMRSDAELREAMHLVRADLDLDRLTRMGDDGGVQRLVTCLLYTSDVVLETTGYRLPQRVDNAENAVAVLHRVDLHADRGQVVDLREVLVLPCHLLPDRVDVLRPASDLGLDAHTLKLPGEDLAQVRDQSLAFVALAEDSLGDVVVGLGLEVSKGEILQLPLDLPDPQPVSQGGVDVERLARDLAPLQIRQRVERPHVVETVRELDEDDPKVLGHRDHHLADVLRLLLLVGPQRDAAELGDPFDQA